MKAKKIVSLLLAAAMTVSMAACGGSNQTSASKKVKYHIPRILLFFLNDKAVSVTVHRCLL